MDALRTVLCLFVVLIPRCRCLAEFDLFPGFEDDVTTLQLLTESVSLKSSRTTTADVTTATSSSHAVPKRRTSLSTTLSTSQSTSSTNTPFTTTSEKTTTTQTTKMTTKFRNKKRRPSKSISGSVTKRPSKVNQFGKRRNDLLNGASKVVKCTVNESPNESLSMLGMELHCNLNQSRYVECLITTASKKLGILNRVRRFFSPAQLCLLYKTQPHLGVTPTTSFSNTIPYKPFVCPEEENPSNIGPYEVPTQRDLAIHIKTTLRTRFNSFHKQALFFLNDIKEATRATTNVEAKCPSKNRQVYKKCVKHVSNQCQFITKSLVTSLEKQRHDVASFTESSICDYKSMKADPVQLIKTLAMEEASLEFALSGFLRLLSACSRYCLYDLRVYHQRPTRHMSDQDLVIKHFLTRKNYVQLLKENP